MIPDLSHGFEGQFTRIFKAVLNNLFLFLADPNRLLAFKDLQGLILPSAPSHEKVKNLIGIVIDFLELFYSVKVALVDDGCRF